MPEKQPTINQLIQSAIDFNLTELHTCLPGIIDTFDAVTQTAKIDLAIKRLVADGSELQIPPVITVPVVFPSAGGFSVTFPVKTGDEVLVVFSERAIDYWQQSGGVQKPLDRRKHDYTDAIAIIGLHSGERVISSYSTDSLQIRSDDGKTIISVKNNEVDIDLDGTGGVTYNSDGSVAFKNGATITAAGDFVSATGISLSTHLTTGVTPGVGISGVPQ